MLYWYKFFLSFFVWYFGNNSLQYFQYCQQLNVSHLLQQCFKLRIWSHLLKKSLMENFVFCVVFSSLPSPEYSMLFCTKEFDLDLNIFNDSLIFVGKHRVTNSKLFQIYGRVQSSYLIRNFSISEGESNLKLSSDILSKNFAKISLNASFLDFYFHSFFFQCEHVKLDIGSVVILQNKFVFSAVLFSDEPLFLSFFWNLCFCLFCSLYIS